MGPAGVPSVIVSKLHKAVQDYLKSPDLWVEFAREGATSANIRRICRLYAVGNGQWGPRRYAVAELFGPPARSVRSYFGGMIGNSK